MGTWTRIVAALLLTALPASSAPIFHTDRASWETAAGPPTFSEDFSGFSADTSFRTAPVALQGLSIAQLGSGSFRNIIDVGPPPFDHTEHDGSNHASIFSNASGGPTSAVQVELVFDQPNRAFGFEHWAAADQEGARLEIYDGFVLLGSLDLSNAFGGFSGYILGPGEQASRLLLRSVNNLVGPGDPGEGYGIDALAGVPVPEPASGGLLALGLVALSRRRRRGRSV